MIPPGGLDWPRDSSYMVRLYRIMRTQVGSAICIHKDLFLDDAMVTHVVTCQGRDHIVSIRSGCRSPVIVNVHFEPQLTLRSQRERLRLITPHWPLYPEAIGCKPEEGRFNVWNMTFTDGDTGKAALFHSLPPPRTLEIAQPAFTRRDSTADGITRTLSRIDRAFINLPMAEARDFHCYSHVLENLEERSIPSDHAAVRVVSQKPTIRGNQGKRIPSWMSKHPVFCSVLKQISENHQLSDDPFAALAEFKFVRATRELLRKTPGSLGAKLFTALYDPTETGILAHSCFA